MRNAIYEMKYMISPLYNILVMFVQIKKKQTKKHHTNTQQPLIISVVREHHA